MNEVHKILLNNLEKLINCIEGEYFISDGALLGYKRENKLIQHDDDIDIYLLPNSYINKNKLKEYDIDIQKYYICDKIYSKNYTKIKKNKWFEYLDHMRNLEENKNLNRAELFLKASKTYKEKSIDIEFSYPYIDIFYLKELNDTEYILPLYLGNIHSCNYFKIPKIWCKTNKVNFCGIENVSLPNNIDDILYLLYGKNWKIPTKKRDYTHNKI